MVTSVLVADAINQYLTNGKDSGGESFGIFEVMAAGVNPTQQFVGSFNYSIGRADDGSLDVELWNRTSMTSAAYQQLPSWFRSQFGPGGNMDQTYSLHVPCSQ
jgi:hypothetical protein